MDEVTVAQVEPKLVIGMLKHGRYQEIATMIPELFEFAVEKGIEMIDTPIFICHEMSVEEVMKAEEEGNATVEVAIPVLEKGEDTDSVRFYELPGGKMAKIIHKGPYEEVGPSYEKLFTWIEQNGKKVIGFTREVYLNDPREVPPEEILTEIYVPII